MPTLQWYSQNNYSSITYLPGQHIFHKSSTSITNNLPYTSHWPSFAILASMSTYILHHQSTGRQTISRCRPPFSYGWNPKRMMSSSLMSHCVTIFFQREVIIAFCVNNAIFILTLTLLSMWGGGGINFNLNRSLKVLFKVVMCKDARKFLSR